MWDSVFSPTQSFFLHVLLKAEFLSRTLELAPQMLWFWQLPQGEACHRQLPASIILLLGVEGRRWDALAHHSLLLCTASVHLFESQMRTNSHVVEVGRWMHESTGWQVKGHLMHHWRHQETISQPWLWLIKNWLWSIWLWLIRNYQNQTSLLYQHQFWSSAIFPWHITIPVSSLFLLVNILPMEGAQAAICQASALRS